MSLKQIGAATMTDAVEAAIEALRAKLIDLTANNRLLNFRHGGGAAGTQSVLRFVGKPPNKIFTRLRDQKSFYVQPVPEPTPRELADFYREPGGIPGLESDDARNRSRPDPARWAKYIAWDAEFELPVEDDAELEGRNADNRIRTLLFPDQLEARLRRLRSNARLAVEESGSNMLFLALGFLDWRDPSSKTQNDGGRAYQAPLILVPATIETETNARGQRRLTLSWSGEDLQTNLSLRKKLSMDFGIELPEFDETELPDPYFDRVRRAVSSQTLWRVRRFATLALITNLGKLLLYLDLDPAKWPANYKPADHPTVRGLLGGGDPASVNADESPPDERATAKTIDLDLGLVDRADGTQAKALLAALSGGNLVIQGPPGTGKSQTITNLIAAALHRGKTVLFVAEKLAALEVVRRRLREAELGDFCLELHSHKTRKKAFFEDIRARLEKRQIGMPEHYQAGLRALAERRRELDDYVVAIGRQAGSTGMTTADLLFEAGRIRTLEPASTKNVDEAGLADKVGAAFDTLTVDRYTERETVRGLEEAAEAANGLVAHGGPARCAWRGARADSLLAVDARAGQRLLSEWRDRAQLAADAMAALNAMSGIPLPSSRSTLNQIRRLAQCSGSLPALFTLAAEAQTALDELSGRFDLKFGSGLRGLVQAVRVVELAAGAPHDALQFGHAGLDFPNTSGVLERLDQAIRRRSELAEGLRGLIAESSSLHAEEASLRAAGKFLLEANWASRFGTRWRQARRFARPLMAVGALKNPRMQGRALLTLADRVALDRELDTDIEIQTVCGAHFRGWMTDVSKLRSAFLWRERVYAAFRGRSERRMRDGILGARSADLSDIQEYASGPLSELKALADRLFDDSPGGESAGLWPAIARQVAPQLLAEVIAAQSNAADVAVIANCAKDAVKAGDDWQTAAQEAVSTLNIDAAVWFGAPSGQRTADEEASRAELALMAPEALVPWLAYERAKARARSHGGEHVLSAFEDDAFGAADVAHAWRVAWLTDAARKLRGAEPVLRRFDGMQLAGARAEYARLDAAVMEMRRRTVAADLMRRQPPQGNNSPRTKEMTELVLLRRCIAMATRHPAIRDVTARAGKALQALKPCFMMGPLSVAQYLAPGALSFDLVIMDEASQIRPEDAIGAVARGGQLIVVGDDRQLPPTSFFDRLGAEEDGTDSADDGGLAGQNDESILALANGAFPGAQGMLQWHYRSRHPELIAFSNHQFYDDKLIVFPAPQESDQRIGLRREFIPNGTALDGVNDTEARTVAQAAVDHLRSRPSQSLMVVAMNIKQKERIESHVNRLRTGDVELGLVLDESESDARIEPFVVNNLENVQGDERDFVMISMTYGPREIGGPVPQNFGPINQDKGHRRLNVLFSRAKEQMVVFTSMRSNDIQAGPDSKPGLQALQGFLRFAETKQLPSGSRTTGKPPGSPFEEAVARELERKGYKVEPQLGVAGYYTDIAVRNPEGPEQFLLGIECDGAQYHSTLSARDRDRLRQEVLENLGWEIERIWSVDWFRDPTQELKRVLGRLDQLRAPRKVEMPGEQVIGETGILAEEKLFTSDLFHEATEATAREEGHPTRLQTRGRLTREEVRTALIALREKIEAECPNADPSRGLLRQNMIDELLRKRPADPHEWRAKIPLHLRQATDGDQFKRYGGEVFEIVSGE
jgi:very-short-patch-repair endonuclease